MNILFVIYDHGLLFLQEG